MLAIFIALQCGLRLERSLHIYLDPGCRGFPTAMSKESMKVELWVGVTQSMLMQIDAAGR